MRFDSPTDTTNACTKNSLLTLARLRLARNRKKPHQTLQNQLAQCKWAIQLRLAPSNIFVPPEANNQPADTNYIEQGCSSKGGLPTSNGNTGECLPTKSKEGLGHLYIR